MTYDIFIRDRLISRLQGFKESSISDVKPPQHLVGHFVGLFQLYPTRSVASHLNKICARNNFFRTLVAPQM